jgi:valyl-tRNA synthetase
MKDDALTRAYEPTETERRWHDAWMRAGAFRPQARFGNDAAPFIVLLPPPNVTGVLHMGHILSSTIQDVFVRYQRMLGRETLWWPGTDHAGIATQKVVEKKLRQDGIEPRELGRDKFVQVCWDWKTRSHEHIVHQMQRVGWSLDWEREYFTLDAHMSDAVREAFIRLYQKGLVYRGRYITNWCPNCKTALSDEEVRHEEAQGTLWTVRYPRVDGNGFVEVATTRPETILGDVAVAIHPDDARAGDLVGTRLRLPVLGREIPVVADPYVDPEFGTGLVKITPAHDPNDFHVGKRHGLQMPVVIDPDGRMNQHAGPFEGLDRFEARDQLLRRLEDEGLLVEQKAHAFSRGTHDRCATIIEPYLSEQWFVRMKPLAEPAIRAVEQGRVHFYPERWRNVYLHWMNNIQDWCISRQLWWGHRIPVYYCNGCGEQVAAHEAPAGACAACGNSGYRQDEDVLDTWFSSWLCPISPMGWPQDTDDLRHFHPTTMLATGPDIIFFWVARMIMASLEFVGEVPFAQVLLNGILRDSTGRKISKSHGNAIDPLQLIDKYGADALRFSTVMLSPAGQDTFFDASSVVTGRDFANKIWKVSRRRPAVRVGMPKNARPSTAPRPLPLCGGAPSADPFPTTRLRACGSKTAGSFTHSSAPQTKSTRACVECVPTTRRRASIVSSGTSFAPGTWSRSSHASTVRTPTPAARLTRWPSSCSPNRASF